MKPRWMAVLVLGLFAVHAGAQEPAALKTEKEKVSYGIGIQFAMILKSQGIDVDSDLLFKGLKDTLSGAKLLMTDEELRATLTALQEQVKQRQEQAQSLAAENNKKAGEAFLAENAKKPGVVTQPSGLQYKILKTGQGPKPTDDDTVVCQYRGTLIDGTEFDSSFSTGQPATFMVKALIPGFKEALQLMPVGSTWQFFIPSGLAYGETGASDVVGPNSALIFEVELISIEAKR